MTDEGNISLEEFYNKILSDNKNLQSKLDHQTINTATNDYEQKRQMLLKTEIEEKLKENSFLKFLSVHLGKSVPYLYELIIDESPDGLKRLEQKHPFKYSYKKMFIQALNKNKQDFLDYLINEKNINMFGDEKKIILDENCLFNISFNHAITTQDWDLFKFFDQRIKITKLSTVNYTDCGSFEQFEKSVIDMKVSKFYLQAALLTLSDDFIMFDYIYNKLRMHYTNNMKGLQKQKLLKIDYLVLSRLPLARLQQYIELCDSNTGFGQDVMLSVINSNDVDKLKFILEFNKKCYPPNQIDQQWKYIFIQPKSNIITTTEINMVKFIAPYMQYDELVEMLIKSEKIGNKEVVDYLSTML